jgi:hypothetical protein
MAEERDVPSKVSQAYRDLGTEEPPRALDDAILAAARRPARSWAQRWGLPLSLAAVVVLSVTVTLRVQHEAPGIEQMESPRKEPAAQPEPAAKVSAPQPAVADAKPAEPPRSRSEARPPAAPKAFPASKPVPEPARARMAEAPAAPPPVPAAAGATGPAVQADRAEATASAELRASRDQAARASAPMASAAPQAALAKRAEDSAGAKLAQETPEQELERIARLRAEGRHEDADKALAEFRKRFPDYRIPEPMLQRVERR